MDVGEYITGKRDKADALNYLESRPIDKPHQRAICSILTDRGLILLYYIVGVTRILLG